MNCSVKIRCNIFVFVNRIIPSLIENNLQRTIIFLLFCFVFFFYSFSFYFTHSQKGCAIDEILLLYSMQLEMDQKWNNSHTYWNMKENKWIGMNIWRKYKHGCFILCTFCQLHSLMFFVVVILCRFHLIVFVVFILLYDLMSFEWYFVIFILGKNVCAKAGMWLKKAKLSSVASLPWHSYVSHYRLSKDLFIS